MKLWEGRLTGENCETMELLNSSISIDSRLYADDIRGSIAHAKMLSRTGVISLSDGEAITAGLRAILGDIESGALEIDPTAEDIHTFVEGELTRRVGDPGKRLHTARSRNDQTALDTRLYAVRMEDELIKGAKALVEALCTVSSNHLDTVMPGYTHMQRAQPVTLAHHMMAYAEMFLRDIDRLGDCRRRTAVSPLGSGALAGTTYPIDRAYTAERLGFSGYSRNSMDGVADRDFVLELSGALSILMMHLSRISEEMVYWNSWEFGFVTFSEAFTTGSSIMPQKKNPDAAELVRGKCARVYGDNMTLLTMMKGLPMSYDKDMQEDKAAIFDAIDTVALCLDVMAPMLLTADFHREKMAAAASHGFINATDCADFLVKKGVPFRDAYHTVGKLVSCCISSGLTLETLPLETYVAHDPHFDSGVYEAIDLLNCVSLRSNPGGPAPASVKAHIAAVRDIIVQ